jgi:hypothetical protein
LPSHVRLLGLLDAKVNAERTTSMSAIRGSRQAVIIIDPGALGSS